MKILSSFLASFIFLFLISPLSVLAAPCRGVVFASFDQASYDKLVDMKVNLVRYDVVFDDPGFADNSNSTTYAAWLDEELVFFDTVLAELKARNIYTVLGLHTPPGGFASRTGEVTHKIFTESWAQAALVTAWQKIANRYKGESFIYAYDLVNEPAQYKNTVSSPLKDWNGLAIDVIKAIRAIEPSKKLIMTSRFGDPKHFKTLQLMPFDNIDYTFHFYNPIKYSHMCIDPNGKCPLDTTKQKKLKLVTYPNAKNNKKSMKQNMKEALVFQKKHGVNLYVGEFGTARWAPGGDKYIRDVIKIFEKKNICWSYSSWNPTVDVWNFEYGADIHNKTKSSTMTGREVVLREYLNLND